MSVELLSAQSALRGGQTEIWGNLVSLVSDDGRKAEGTIRRRRVLSEPPAQGGIDFSPREHLRRKVRDQESITRRSFPQVALPVISNEGLLPLAAAQWAQERPRAVFVAGDDATFQALARALKAFLPDREVRLLPPWDSSPYDRSRPSRRVTGTRVATLAWLAEHSRDPGTGVDHARGAAAAHTTPERLLERAVVLEPGRQLDFEWLQATAAGFGYDVVDRVEDVGDIAIRPGVVDIFPAGSPLARPPRIAGGHYQEHSAFRPARSAHQVRCCCCNCAPCKRRI